MTELSIIIPFAGEHPQALFTIQSIAKSLLYTEGKPLIDFEIIAVDNFCPELEDQWEHIDRREAHTIARKVKENGEVDPYPAFMEALKNIPTSLRENKAGEAIEASAGGNPWLKYMKFTDRLSHWECKRLACQAAEADTFLFIDAHCVPTQGIDEMYQSYQQYREYATMHMPLTYKILEWHRLIYKLKITNNFYGYAFTGFPGIQEQFNELPQVPCMSTCGMMISREVYDAVGGWPEGMTMYGGGENFMNYALAVCGFRKHIYPFVTLHHHGAGRDYHYTHDGIIWNRMIAHYLFGGITLLHKLSKEMKGRPEVLNKMAHDIMEMPVYRNHRNFIRDNQATPIEEWAAKWLEK